MLISQLILVPVLVFEVWFYLEVVRRRAARGARALDRRAAPGARALDRRAARGARAFDAVVIAAATLACLALLPLVAGHDSGGNDRIWRPVLSVLTTFFTFPAVLLGGLMLRAGRGAQSL